MRLRFADRLVELLPRERVVMEKCATFEESMLLRPGRGRGVPPTLMLEWLGQTAALLVAESTDFAFLPLVGKFDRCRFGPPLLAGDRATLVIAVRSWRDDAAIFDGLVTGPRGEALAIERALTAFVPLPSLWDPAELRAAARAARGEFPGPSR